MSTAFNAADALTFVQSYADLPIKGDPGHTLQNYLNTHLPTYGVIVNPALGVDVLVWYDAANNLHVIDDVGKPFASSVAAPDYHTADESLVYDLEQRTIDVAQKAGDYVAAIPGALPSPQNLIYIALGVLALIYIVPLLPKSR